MISLSYIVISYNRCTITTKCIASLLNVIRPEDEIILVDNGSTDGTVEAFLAQKTPVTFVRSEQNLGVAGGRNLGIKHAKGTVCVFLDDDASFISSDVSEHIVNHLQNDPLAEGLAFTIIDANTGKEQISSIPGRKKAIWNKPARCSYFCGAGFAVRRSAFERFGLFWELLFYAGEELEFGYRVIRAGGHFLFVDDISVLHESTPVARPSGQHTYYYMRNRSLIALKYLPLPFLISHLIFWWLFLAVKAGRIRSYPWYLRGIRDFLKLAPDVIQNRRVLAMHDLIALKKMHGRVVY